MSKSLAIARAAVGAGFRTWIRETALEDTTGFGPAWKKANQVPGWFLEANAAVFWGVISERRPDTIVEIGSYLGRSTTLLGLALQAFGQQGCRLVAIDPHTGDRQHLANLRVDKLPSLDLFLLHTSGAGIDGLLETHVAPSQEVASYWRGCVDLLFVDGWHSYDAVRSDADDWLPRLSPQGVVCFDDFGTYTEVRQAVVDVCRGHNLHLYGSVLDQAWAGREADPPRAIRAVTRLNALRRLVLSGQHDGTQRRRHKPLPSKQRS